MTLLSVLGLGLFLGMRHATDADHVVAVTTLLARRPSPRAALLLGAWWGVGHGITLFLVGGTIILLGLVIPPRLGLLLELGVALMLIALGVMNATRAPGSVQHAAHGADHTHAGRPRGLRSCVVGVVHGLAGSAAVALLVLSTIRETAWAFLYLGLFGVGTVAGMMLLTTALSIPVAAAARRFGALERQLAHFTGALSVAVGIFLVYQIGFVDGLFGSHPTWTPE